MQSQSLDLHLLGLGISLPVCEITGQPRIHNVVFDMGGVLARYDMPAYVASQVGNPDVAKQLHDCIFASPEWILMDHGRLEEKLFLERILSRLPEDLHERARFLFANWHKSMCPIAEVTAIARRLIDAGYPLYLLSNASKRFHQYRVQLPILNDFQACVISADWQDAKPSVSIYQRLMIEQHLAPEESVFIDDMGANVAGANLAGLWGVHYQGDALRLEKALQCLGLCF